MDRLEKSDFWQTSRVRKGTVSVNFILSVKKFKAGGALWAFFRRNFLSFFCFLSFPEIFEIFRKFNVFSSGCRESLLDLPVFMR